MSTRSRAPHPAHSDEHDAVDLVTTKAWEVISGLISSNLLTLVVIPVLYRLAMRFE